MGGQGSAADNQLAQNIRDACARARRNGVEVYGFGIGTNNPQHYYGKEWFVRLSEDAKMNTEFFKQFSDIITAGKVKVG